MVLKKSQKGGYYLEIDDFEPKEKSGTTYTAKNEGQFTAQKEDTSLPF
jgi:hypothetical protein